MSDVPRGTPDWRAEFARSIGYYIAEWHPSGPEYKARQAAGGVLDCIAAAGYVIVPRDPTEAMVRVAIGDLLFFGPGRASGPEANFADVADAWRSMIALAQPVT